MAKTMGWWLPVVLGFFVTMTTVSACKRPPPKNEHVRRNCLASKPSPNQGLVWREGANGKVPSGAVKGGDEGNYIGRAQSGGQWVTGKVVSNHGGLFIASGGKELKFTKYQVLVNKDGEDLEWRGAGNGLAPNGSVPTAGNCHFFVCSAQHAIGGKSVMVPGNMDPPGLHCSVPYNGLEHKKPNYRVLINKVPKQYWLTDVTFDLAKAQTRVTPKRLAVKRFANLSGRRQTLAQPVLYNQRTTRHWEPTFGARLNIPIHYDVSIPVIGPESNGTRNITIKGGINYEGVWGREDKSEEQLTITAFVTLPPKHAADVSVLSNQGSLRVPYSAKLHVLFIDGTTKTKTLTGWFKGANLFAIRVSVGEIEPVADHSE